MKTLVKLLLLIAFVVVSPVVVLLLPLKASGYSADRIKQELRDSQVYTQLVSELNAQIDQALKEGEADDPLRLLAPIIRREITAPYLEGKIETLIDSTSRWATGESNNPPIISLADLKDKLVKQNPALVRELERASRDLPDIDFEKLIKSDWVIPLDKQLSWLKTLYRLTQWLPALVGLMALSLIGLVAFSDTTRAKFVWAAVAFLVSFFWNLALWLIVASASLIISQALTGQAEIPAFVGPLVTTLFKPLAASYLRLGAVVLGAFLLASIICFILAASSRESTTKARCPQRQ